jgi:hypothetical protein
VISTRNLAISFSLAVLSAALGQAQDLSTCRGFQFGMTLVEVAKQAGMKTSEAKTLHQHPAMIQELWWQRPIGDPSTQADPVGSVIFSFCDGELFRMVLNYDLHRTERLTEKDMIEAISSRYGRATMPVATIIRFSSSQVYNESEKVLARWEDAQHSFDLFCHTYGPTFGMVLLSKQRDALAQAAVVEAIRLDSQEAPHRGIGRPKKQY